MILFGFWERRGLWETKSDWVETGLTYCFSSSCCYHIFSAASLTVFWIWVSSRNQSTKPVQLFPPTTNFHGSYSWECTSPPICKTVSTMISFAFLHFKLHSTITPLLHLCNSTGTQYLHWCFVTIVALSRYILRRFVLASCWIRILSFVLIVYVYEIILLCLNFFITYLLILLKCEFLLSDSINFYLSEFILWFNSFLFK